MNGVLGTTDLLANINQAVYFNNYDTASVVVVNLCNRGTENTLVSIAVSVSATNPSNAEWIEFNLPLSPKNTLERTGIAISTGKYLVVKSSNANVNAVCYGVTNGTTPLTGISQNLGTAPTWVSDNPLSTVYAGDPNTNIQLSATDTEGESVSYSLTSGSLQGLSLSSTGLISGTASVTGYFSGIADATTTATITATDSRNNSTQRAFSIVKRWRDGSSSGQAAVSAEAIKAMTNTTTNAQYWIQPVGAPSAQQVFCIMDTSIGDGGGWMAAFNILSNTTSGMPGGAADWGNADFWDTRDGTFNTGSALTANFKNNLYGYFGVRKINILLHNISNTSFRGFGQYNLLSSVSNRTLFQLCGGGFGTAINDNTIASGARTAGSGTNASGAVRNTNRSQTEGGDIFIDGQNSAYPLIFRQRGPWDSSGGELRNAVRISTTIGNGNKSYGHTYAGIGGTHEHSGWKGDFAMAPISAYCQGPQSYGDRTSGVNMTRFDGWSYPYETSCTDYASGPGQLNVGYGVFVK